MQWLDQLPSDHRTDIVELARKKRSEVAKSCKEGEFERKKIRQEKMVREKSRRDAQFRRAVKEKERLSRLHLIVSSEELKRIF